LGAQVIDQMIRRRAHKIRKTFLGKTIIPSAVMDLDTCVFDKRSLHSGNLGGLADDKAADNRPEDAEPFCLSNPLDKFRFLRQPVKKFGRKFSLEFLFDFGYFVHQTILLSFPHAWKVISQKKGIVFFYPFHSKTELFYQRTSPGFPIIMRA
jgi:hypothetical protein